MSDPKWDVETAKATLDCARADVDAEDDRMKVLDGKLSTIATFSGLSVSISATLGANVLVSGKLDTGFTAALGIVLIFVAAMLLMATLEAFRGLRPKEYKGITLAVATARVTPRRLRLPPADAMAKLASTYYTEMLPAARDANGVKLGRVVGAFRYCRLGLVALVLAVALTAAGSVVGKGAGDGGPSKGKDGPQTRLPPWGQRGGFGPSGQAGRYGIH